jgi:hypothetical protein
VLEAADACVANVTLEVVERVASRLDCGHVVTSGYLLSDRPELPRYEPVERIGEEGWAADLYRRAAQ